MKEQSEPLPSVLIDAETIAQRVEELAGEIEADYRGKDLTVVGVLSGSFIFMGDLVRALRLPLRCDFLGLSSYGPATKSSGVVAITKDLREPLEGQHVLIVEDIVDTGLTMSYLLENLSTRHPESIKSVALLSKPARRQTSVSIDYLGFTIEDYFVAGYGLDVSGLYRNLPYIGIVR